MRRMGRVLAEVGGDQIEFVEHESDVLVQFDQHSEPSVCIVVVLEKKKETMYGKVLPWKSMPGKGKCVM